MKKRRFSRHYLAQHAPTFARMVDQFFQSDFGKVKGKSWDERCMLAFLKQHGFKAKEYGISLDDFGGIEIFQP